MPLSSSRVDRRIPEALSTSRERNLTVEAPGWSAMDEQGEIRPQMVETYTQSADKLTHVFTLRDGLLWQDGTSVTAQDCIASIKRWAAKDTLGQKLISFVDTITAQDSKTFTIKLKEPTGLLIVGLGKPSSNVPFMMPTRVAETDPNTRISDFTGSGPFVFKRDECADKVVYVKFDKYKPRSEPASGLAGGKVAKVDRIEWRAIADPQTAVNALLAGEIDYIESPPHDLIPLLEDDSNVKRVILNRLGSQYFFRPNHLHKPFDNPKIRQALWYAFNQKDFLQAAIGNPNYYKPCKAIFVCGAALASEKGMDGLLESNFEKARDMLREAGYDGTPVVLMHATDLAVLTNLAPVAKSLMERAGFKVDMQSMDGQTLLARFNRKDPPNAGGWNAVVLSWASIDAHDPLVAGLLNARCERARPGWPCDQELEMLRDRYARETDPAKQTHIGRGGSSARHPGDDARHTRPMVYGSRRPEKRPSAYRLRPCRFSGTWRRPPDFDSGRSLRHKYNHRTDHL
jgi:peptide/nickel transport system substrate-binding protein